MDAKGYVQKSVLFLSTLLLLTGSPRPDVSSQRSFRPPECINDGLDVGSLDEVDVKTTLIEKAMNRIQSGMNGMRPSAVRRMTSLDCGFYAKIRSNVFWRDH